MIDCKRNNAPTGMSGIEEKTLGQLIAISKKRGLIDGWAVDERGIALYAGSVTYHVPRNQAVDLLQRLNAHYERVRHHPDGPDKT